MDFKQYLIETKITANEEKGILDQLSVIDELSPIEIRAAKSSLQVLIENMIGKSKQILKYFNSPIIPQNSKDAIIFLHNVGAIEDEEFYHLSSAIGFRNSMIHDYMKFDTNVLKSIIKNKKYLAVYNFLVEEPNYKEVIIKRIENLSI
jgi:uncharacterized protein YutE (UPF0331/DUF86 family)